MRQRSDDLRVLAVSGEVFARTVRKKNAARGAEAVDYFVFLV
jgi:hypothetical protein